MLSDPEGPGRTDLACSTYVKILAVPPHSRHAPSIESQDAPQDEHVAGFSAMRRMVHGVTWPARPSFAGGCMIGPYPVHSVVKHRDIDGLGRTL